MGLEGVSMVNRLNGAGVGGKGGLPGWMLACEVFGGGKVDGGEGMGWRECERKYEGYLG